MRAHDYGPDILATGARRRTVPEVPAQAGLVVEDATSGFCGAVVHLDTHQVTLEDRHGRQRLFPLRPAAFLLDGQPVTLVRPAPTTPTAPRRSASGSRHVAGLRARTARASRLWVEGRHDAELVERVWGHDLRVEGIVVEPLDGVDHLAEQVTRFQPAPHRRLGVLVDHLVPGSKESRLVAAITHADVLVTGHPYVDIWQAVRPACLGIPHWPSVPKGQSWKDGVCAALGWADPAQGWARVLAAVTDFRDLETPLIGAVERLIDFVTRTSD
ncbi:DUF3097 domain-containing protein [Goodfellowiella coeruleoviolacea]|uniref:DUF3097 domain-containing protein n=1 Tax=Goodfellowiella coeruleoviolacea TaxID=334858 RepID=A0AAE3GJZ4_9PSEU|nr:DUF3097 domain-containing protein [Goodfellowiella coeruleoviolacea]MCP2167563.1 Protein of unknown function (DUF3097) [Goodfellowiella coeruleoviolacea]